MVTKGLQWVELALPPVHYIELVQISDKNELAVPDG